MLTLAEQQFLEKHNIDSKDYLVMKRTAATTVKPESKSRKGQVKRELKTKSKSRKGDAKKRAVGKEGLEGIWILPVGAKIWADDTLHTEGGIRANFLANLIDNQGKSISLKDYCKDDTDLCRRLSAYFSLSRWEKHLPKFAEETMGNGLVCRRIVKKPKGGVGRPRATFVYYPASWVKKLQDEGLKPCTPEWIKGGRKLRRT